MSEYYGLGKFKTSNEEFFNYLEKLQALNINPKEIIFNFPAFVGDVNLARFMFFYDIYKEVLNLNGNIADIGTFKGASFLFFAKMVKLFEPYNRTQVFAFDWFEGMKPAKEDTKTYNGQYIGDYNQLIDLIEWQGLQNIAIVNKMDLTKDLDNYFQDKEYMRYKIVFIDCGIADVIDQALKHFWPRLINGGILLMDHYNCEASKKESTILEKYIGNNIIRQTPFTRQPTCYVKKQV